jgi:hypothetical protein
MKRFVFTFKGQETTDAVWSCKAINEDIAWNAFALIKNLELSDLKRIFQIKINE